MTMRIYSSADASAPTLQGVVGGAFGTTFAAGSLLELLRQVLVSGYGSQTAAGWTMPFTGTSQAAFKQGAGCGFYVNILDDGTMTAGAREAQFSGFETMSAIGVGTGQFPTTAQQATLLKVRKSDTADATVRPWIIFADNKTFYLFVMPQTATQYLAAMTFGNFHTYVPNDAYNCIAIGRITSAIIDATANETLDLITLGTGQGSSVLAGHYVPRGYSQLGTAVQVAKAPIFMSGTNGASSLGGHTQNIAFPNPSDSTLMLARCYITDGVTSPTNSVRGFLRGLWAPWHSGANIPFNFVFNGAGLLSGRTFQVLGLRSGTTTASRYTMETSDTWDS